MFFESIYSDSDENFLGVFDSEEIGINSYFSYKNTLCKNNDIVYNVIRLCNGTYRVYYVCDDDTVEEWHISFKSLKMNKIVDLDSF